MSSLEAHIFSLVTAAASIAVGFGFFGGSTEQVVVSVAGTALAAVFQIAHVLHLKVGSK